ncbi:MAG: diguanylate cyclase [Gallionella sp.]
MDIPQSEMSVEDAYHLHITSANKVDLGAIVVNPEGEIWFWNRWMVAKSGVTWQNMVGKKFFDQYPELSDSRLESAINDALRHGLSSKLVQALHRSPLPLFHTLGDSTSRLQQSIQVIAIEDRSHNRYCLLLINDVSTSVRKEQALREQAEQLRSIAYMDALTGIPNRRRLDEYLQDEIRRAARNSTTLSVIMVDVDLFKPYNDKYGHQAGDFCLQRIANALKAALQRPADLVARYGGEEFAIILPDTPLEGAKLISQNLFKHIESLAIPHEASSIVGHITLSMGISKFQSKSQISGSILLSQADQALYQSKHDGRNRLTVFSEIPPQKS